jgi:tRNA dimethylallyltransferase
MNIFQKIHAFIKTSKAPILVLLGPTASGKTALSLKIAKAINGEIISTDSRQIYKGIHVSSDVLPKSKRKGIPHHMMEITTPDKELSLAEYKDLAMQKIEEIRKRKHIPMLVGGTGLYISAIIEGYDVPRIAPDKKLREKLYKQAEKYGAEYIHKKLQKLDPAAAKSIHPNNIRYVVRAIEINLKGKRNKVDKKAKKPQFDTLMIGINWPREKLYERIGLRVDNQIKRGLVKEAKKFIKKYKTNLPAVSSLGIKELIPYIKGEKPLEECVETLKKNTRNYAKRQMTWFRRYKNILWIDGEKL